MTKLLHIALMSFSLHLLIACSNGDEDESDTSINNSENPISAENSVENAKEGIEEESLEADDGEGEKTKPTPKTNENIEKPKTIYLGVPSSFVVNINDGHILQIKVQLQLNNKDLATHIRRHKYPPIQSTLNNLFSTAIYEDMLTMEGKETLRKQALQEVLKIMKTNKVQGEVEDVLFTNVIVQ